MSQRRSCYLQDGISYNMLCSTGKTCLTGGHVFLEGMYYRRACITVEDALIFTGGYVL